MDISEYCVLRHEKKIYNLNKLVVIRFPYLPIFPLVHSDKDEAAAAAAAPLLLRTIQCLKRLCCHYILYIALVLNRLACLCAFLQRVECTVL